MNTITIPRPLLSRLIRDNGRGEATVKCPATLVREGSEGELLVRPPGGVPPWLSIKFGIRPEVLQPRDDDLGVFWIGRGAHRGEATGVLRVADRIESIDRLKIVGPGMHSVFLNRSPAGGEGSDDPPDCDVERWSRTIGALGLPTWERLRSLRYTLVGAGRTGSLLARGMTSGWGSMQLAILDPDFVELSNIGETDGFRSGDVGFPKADVLASRLRSGHAALTANSVRGVQTSASRLAALREIRRTDVVIGAVDADGARLALAALSSLFLRPYLDTATGIHGEGSTRRMGADIRLSLPGSGCLLCRLGGLADPKTGVATLVDHRTEQTFYRDRAWKTERAGSLRSLNQLAASVALRLVEDFVAERVDNSIWIRLEYDPAGRLAISYPRTEVSGCLVCAAAGRGEEGISDFRSALGEDNVSI